MFLTESGLFWSGMESMFRDNFFFSMKGFNSVKVGKYINLVLYKLFLLYFFILTVRDAKFENV